MNSGPSSRTNLTSSKKARNIEPRLSMSDRIWYTIKNSDIVRHVKLGDRSVITSKLPIPEWADRGQPLVDL